MDFNRAAATIGDELKAKGYSVRTEFSGHHPRIVIGMAGKERFVVGSGSASYDEPRVLDNFRRDVNKELANLPAPPFKLNGNGAAHGIAVRERHLEIARVCPVKVFLRGAGLLTVQLPRAFLTEVFGAGEPPKAQLALTVGQKKLNLMFGEAGTAASGTISPDYLAFVFPRATVPFEYATKMPPGVKGASLTGRMIGGALITDEELPEYLFTGRAPREASEHSVDEGVGLREMFNDWLAWAERAGHEPRVTVEKGRLVIEVAEKKSRRL